MTTDRVTTMNTTTNTATIRCDYGSCTRIARHVLEAGADQRTACAIHAPRIVAERCADTPEPVVTDIGHRDVIVDADGNVLQDFVLISTHTVGHETWGHSLGNNTAPLRFLGVAAGLTPNEHYAGIRGQVSHYTTSMWTRP